MNLFIAYPKCSTCKRVQDCLDKKNIIYQYRDIKKEAPTREELYQWSQTYQVPVVKFFNTSGILYREWGLKDKIKTMSEGEMLDLLSKDGMLVKRPILIMENDIIIGYKKDYYEA